MIHQKLINMKKNLTEEIQIIRKNMGLVTESILKLSRKLTQELYEYLAKKYRNKYNPYKTETDRLRQYLDDPGTVSANEVENIVGTLIDADVRAKKIISNIIYTEWEKNATKTLENFRKRILVAKKNNDIGLFGGGVSNFTRTVDEINRRVDNATIVGYSNPKIINEIKNRLKVDLYKTAYKIYNSPGERFVKGWKAGKFDQSVNPYVAFKYALNKGYQLLRKVASKVTTGKFKVKDWDENFNNIYSPEQRKLLNQWFIAGLPDTPQIYNSLREKGLLFATGRATRQLWKKYIIVTIYSWIVAFLDEYSSSFRDEKELTDEERKEIDEQGTLKDLADVIVTAWRTLDFAPALKYVSPAFFAGIGLTKLFAVGQYGDIQALENRMKKYLLKSKEGNFSLKPSEVIDDMIWMAKHIPEISKSISQELAEIKRQLQAQGELARNNQKVDSTDKVVTADTKKTPETTQTVKTPVSTDTMALYKKFLKEKYPKRTFDNPVNLGNNMFEPFPNSPFTYHKFNGQTFVTMEKK